MEEILRYFPGLTEHQRDQMAMLAGLYTDWNSRINVISRKDIDNVMVHHVLHSLAIAKFLTPVPSTTFLDLGTGGGFPGIPLAIMWPHCRLHLIDRIGKKITVAREVAAAIGLDNVTFQHGDAGECHEKFDFVVSRAVMRLDSLVNIVKRNISRNSRNGFPNGLIALKGGDLEGEMANVKAPIIEVPLTDWFSEEYFQTKKLIYVEL